MPETSTTTPDTAPTVVDDPFEGLDAALAPFAVVWINDAAGTETTVATADTLNEAKTLAAGVSTVSGPVEIRGLADRPWFRVEKGTALLTQLTKIEIEKRRENIPPAEEPERTAEDEPETPASPGTPNDRHSVRSELFSGRDYDDPRLTIETDRGERIDEIVVKVSGSLLLNRKSPEACALFRALERGRPVNVELIGHVISKGETDKIKGEDEIIVGERKITVTALRKVLVAGEEHIL
jgi:hypothetical protein